MKKKFCFLNFKKSMGFSLSVSLFFSFFLCFFLCLFISFFLSFFLSFHLSSLCFSSSVFPVSGLQRGKMGTTTGNGTASKTTRNIPEAAMGSFPLSSIIQMGKWTYGPVEILAWVCGISSSFGLLQFWPTALHPLIEPITKPFIT